MDKLYYSYDDMVSNCRVIVREMAHDGYMPDVIIGPGRGAYPFGVMLSHYFEVPFEAFRWQTRDGAIEDSETLRHILSKYNDKTVLVVDDINDTGATLTKVSDYMMEMMLRPGQWRSAVLVNNLPSPFEPDYHCFEINKQDEDVWVVVLCLW